MLTAENRRPRWIVWALIGVGVLVLGTSVLTLALQSTRPQAGQTAPLSSGASATVDDVQVAVLGARILLVEPSHLPAANHEFVAVQVRLANTGGQGMPYSISDFTLRGLDGTRYQPDPAGAYLVGAAAMPAQGKLGPHVPLSGEIVYQIPMAAHAVVMGYQPGSGPAAGNQIEWTVIV